MANITDENPIKIDTAGAAVDLPGVRSIIGILWTGSSVDPLANADDLVIRHAVEDTTATGNFIINKRATGVADGLDINFAAPYRANNGINVLIDAGELFIFLE